MSTELHTAMWVNAGRRILGDGKLYWTWYTLNSEGTDLDPHQMHAFSKPLVKYAGVGSYFRVTSDSADFKTVKQGGEHGPKYVGTLDTPMMRRMVTEMEADVIEYERRGLLKKMDRSTLDSMTLLELREHARSMLPDRRRALLAYVISQLS